MTSSQQLSVYESTDPAVLPNNQVSFIPPVPDQDGRMLSVDFSTPLAGAARSERIRQMSHNHPAFTKSRLTQEILVKIQHSLRRMPGVSSTESAEIIVQLQEVGQIISQETSQLVDALVNLTVDQEDTDKAIARMGLETSLTKAESEDKAQTIRDLGSEVETERKKREQAENDVKKVMRDLHDLTEDFKRVKDKAAKRNEGGGASCDVRDDMIKGLEDTIRHLEDQVNNRRSLWVMKHSDPQSVARAIETLADSVQDNQAAHRTIMSMKPRAADVVQTIREPECSRPYGEPAPPMRPASVFQLNRSSTVAPPKFGPLHAGPPRAPSTFPHERRHQACPSSLSSWGAAPGRIVQGGNPFYGNASSWNRPPTRKAYHAPPARYRSNTTDFQQPGFMVPMLSPTRPGTAFSHHPPPREQYPQTPTSSSRFGRLSMPNQPDFGGASSAGNAIATRSSLTGPLIHMTEQSVATWNEAIMEFYAMIRAFVERHASLPDAAMAMKMSTTPLWPVLLATYHPLSAKEASSYLDIHLRADNPKCCLVTRVIIDYIVNRVWVPNAWVGSDDECTYALLDLERDLEKTQGQPSAQRQPLLDRQAYILDTIIKSEPTSFHKEKVDDMTRSLLGTIKPLLNRLTNPADAYRDLEQVAELAWDLSSKILMSRLTFDFRFPEVGTRFSSQSMLPIWPALDPTELQAKHWRVALVTTPVITCRNDTGSNISAHSVALADVYCMQ